MTAPTEIPVHLYFLLDRSGSMNAIRSDVIGGFNQFLTEQKAKSGKCRLTLVQFDTQNSFEIVHDAVKLANVPELTEDTYVPRGSTPLLDAEGRLMVRAEERASARAAAGKKTEAIVFATYTDGEENDSREWTLEAVCAKKAAHEDEWAFLYLGVGHDAYGQARRIGTQSVNIVSAAATSAGVASTYDRVNAEVGNVRHRASQGLTTNSSQTRAAQDAES